MERLREARAASAAVGGGAPGSADLCGRRRTGRGRLPPHAAAPDASGPGASGANIEIPRPPPLLLARMFHELMSRDREDGRATGQPQGIGSEAYLNGTSQGPTPEDARKDGHIRGQSKRFMKHPGQCMIA